MKSKRLIGRHQVKILLLLAPTLGTILLFFTGAFGIAVGQSFGLYALNAADAHFTLEGWKVVFTNRQTWLAFVYTLKLASVSTVGSVIVAYPLALWLRPKTTRSKVMANLLRTPVLIPGLVAAFLFINFIIYHGFLNEIMVRLGLFSKPHRMLNDRYGVAVMLVKGWKNMPFALLLLIAGLRNIGDDVLAAGRDLGADRWSLFIRVIIPLSLPSLRAALVLLFIGDIGDFAINNILGPSSRQTLSQYMITTYYQFGEAEQGGVIIILMVATALSGAGLMLLLTKLLQKRGYHG